VAKKVTRELNRRNQLQKSSRNRLKIKKKASVREGHRLARKFGVVLIGLVAVAADIITLGDHVRLWAEQAITTVRMISS
jgi:hypothetical protein